MRAHRQLLVDAVGALLAVSAALVGLAAVAGSPRSTFLFFDANSLLLELVHRSLAAGGPQHWAMSAALFFFPEIPVYEAVRSVSASPQHAALGSALIYLVAVYVLLRVIAGQLWRGSRSTVAALVAFLALCLALVYEWTPNRDSLELVSDLLFGGYYNGTVLAVLGSVALVIVLVRGSRRPWLPATGLVVVGALATASNPLYLLWFSAPLGAALLALMIARRLKPTVPLLVAIFAGPALGLLGRIPLDRYVSAPTDRYLHPDEVGDAAAFYGLRLAALTGNPGELLVLLLLAACSVVAVVLVVRRRLSSEAAIAAVLAAMEMPLAFAINIALGTQTVRYLQPMYFAQALAVVVVVGWAPTSARLARLAGRVTPSRRRVLAVVGAALGVGLALGGAGAAVALATTPRTPPASIGCLENWIDGRDLTGVGSYWNVRPAQVYGDDSVSLVQVDDELLADPWLVNLASYHDVEVDYVLYGGTDQPEREAAIAEQLGEPGGVVDCGDFRILDFSGSSEAAQLSERVRESAREFERERGFVD